MKFRKKPVEVEAVQFIGNQNEIVKFSQGEIPFTTMDYMIIPTLEGNHRAEPGDWIIRGVKGEFYPCKPDIFELTYEPVPTPSIGQGEEGV